MKKYKLQIFKQGKTIKIKNTFLRTPVSMFVEENEKNTITSMLKNIYGLNDKDFKFIEEKNSEEIKKKVVLSKNKENEKIKIDDNKMLENKEEIKKEEIKETIEEIVSQIKEIKKEKK